MQRPVFLFYLVILSVHLSPASADNTSMTTSSSNEDHGAPVESNEFVLIMTGVSLGLILFLVLLCCGILKFKDFNWKRRVKNYQLSIKDSLSKSEKLAMLSSGGSSREAEVKPEEEVKSEEERVVRSEEIEMSSLQEVKVEKSEDSGGLSA